MNWPLYLLGYFFFVQTHWNNSYFAPLGHNILLPRKHVFVLIPQWSVLIGEAAYTTLLIFGLTWPGLESKIYNIRGQHANHFTTEVIQFRMPCIFYLNVLTPILTAIDFKIIVLDYKDLLRQMCSKVFIYVRFLIEFLSIRIVYFVSIVRLKFVLYIHDCISSFVLCLCLVHFISVCLLYMLF